MRAAGTQSEFLLNCGVHDLVESHDFCRVAEGQFTQERPVEIAVLVEKRRFGRAPKRIHEFGTNFGIIRRRRIHHVTREFIRIDDFCAQLAEQAGDSRLTATDDSGKAIDFCVGVRRHPRNTIFEKRP